MLETTAVENKNKSFSKSGEILYIVLRNQLDRNGANFQQKERREQEMSCVYKESMSTNI